MDFTILTDSGTQAKLKIVQQWLCDALVVVPATPKAGPGVDQLMPVVFILEQAKKPTGEEIATHATNYLGMRSTEVIATRSYPTSRVQLVTEKEKEGLPSDPGSTDPDTE